jgi:GntR family transcriptional repressor for pyruvate dehydrogenase complex
MAEPAGDAREPIAMQAAVFEPIETPSVVEEVARRIRQAIVLGVLRDGDRLPSETELANRIGVGVMTVRAALSELRAEGLVETHRGRLGGSFVAASDRAVQAAAVEIDPEGYRVLAELLGGLEALAARLAAEHATAEERVALAALVDDLDAPHTPREASDRNNRFHLLIAAASRNPLLVAEISRCRADLHAAAFALSGIRLPLLPGNDPHRLILDALERGDGAAAADLMWAHHRATMEAVLAGAQG